MKLFKVNMSARKIVNTLVATVLWWYFICALLTAAMPSELGILGYIASLGS